MCHFSQPFDQNLKKKKKMDKILINDEFIKKELIKRNFQKELINKMPNFYLISMLNESEPIIENLKKIENNNNNLYSEKLTNLYPIDFLNKLTLNELIELEKNSNLFFKNYLK